MDIGTAHCDCGSRDCTACNSASGYFPEVVSCDGLTVARGGLDLRDHFAAVAMQAGYALRDSPEETARCAYLLADAMMAERGRAGRG